METPVERVRLVMERTGLSQGEFAQQVGLDASKMSKSLAGARRFSSLDLARIAEFGHVSVDWLLTGEEDAVAMAARAEGGTNIGGAAAMAARITELRSSAVALGRGRVTTKVEMPRSGQWAADGEALALSAREAIGGEVHLADDLASEIDRLFGVDVGIMDLGDAVDGLCARTDEAVAILAAPTPIFARQRFTLAHELGHVLAEDDQGIHVDEDVFAAGHRESEQRANAFAAALLMPEAYLREVVVDSLDDVAFANLVLDLKVSPSALAIRLKRLRLVDGMTQTALQSMTMREAQALADRGAEASAASQLAMQDRPPPTLGRDLYEAYLDGDTTLRPYASLLGTDTESLRASLESAGS
ncbi:hypothetical protein CWN80_03350 [Janibacter hoylei PVAS-1]|uniref:HTH cro/C1-type domain-containing protein n=1 Tax=Janibacter hoylei PVAS-1 TaxID=1210046 RepID=A0A444B9W0_9MICO|nr:hypothetical protein CWN80_03350 [Janibacter hoylei PVAS-1]